MVFKRDLRGLVLSVASLIVSLVRGFIFQLVQLRFLSEWWHLHPLIPPLNLIFVSFLSLGPAMVTVHVPHGFFCLVWTVREKASSSVIK